MRDYRDALRRREKKRLDIAERSSRTEGRPTPQPQAQPADSRNGGRPAWYGANQPASAQQLPKGPSQGDKLKAIGAQEGTRWGTRAAQQLPKLLSAAPAASSYGAGMAPIANQSLGAYNSVASGFGGGLGGASVAGVAGGVGGSGLTGGGLSAGAGAYNSVASGFGGGISGAGSAAPATTSMLLSTLPWLGLAGQAYQYGTQGYDAYKKLTNDTAADDGSGSVKAALLSTGPFAGWAAPLVDVVGLKSGKHKDQYQRDAIRKYLKDNGFIDENYNVKLANDGTFNIGDETQSALNVEGNRVYNIDWSDPRTHEMVGAIQPLVDMMIGNHEKRGSDLTGMLVNAALSSGDSAMDSIRGFYQQAGFDRESAAAAINKLAEDAERLSPERRDAYLAAIDGLFPLAQSAAAVHSSAPKSSSGQGGGKPKAPVIPVAPPAPAPPPVAPVPAPSPVDYGQAIANVYQQNAGTPPNAALNPNTLSLNPNARRRVI